MSIAPRTMILAFAFAFLGGCLASCAWADTDAKPRTDRHGDPLPPHALARIGTVRLRHAGPIHGLHFLPGGNALLAGGRNAPLRVWDVRTGKRVRDFDRRRSSWGRATALSPDGKLLACGGEDQTLRLWDVATGKLLRELRGHRGTANGLAFSPDGRHLAGASLQTVYLWEVATGKEVRRFTGCEHTAWRVAFSPDGRTLAAVGGYNDGRVYLWDVPTGKELRRFPGHRRFGRCVAFSPDGKILATGGDDRLIRLWDPATGKRLKEFKGHTEDVSVLLFLDGGKTLASASLDHSVRLWDVATGKTLRRFTAHADGVYALAVAPDGHTLASAGGDQIIRLWDVRTGKERFPSRGHRRPLTALAVSPDGKTVATASQDQTVRLWDLATGAEKDCWEGHADWVRAVAFSPDGKTLAAGGSDGLILLHAVPDGKVLRRLEVDPHMIFCLDFSPDGRTLASGGMTGGCTLWDVATGKRKPWPATEKYSATGLAFSPDGRSLFLVENCWFAEHELSSRLHFRQRVALWDLAEKEPVRVFPDESISTRGGAFSPDGKVVAVTAPRRGIDLWEVATGKTRHTLKGRTPDGPCVAFSPDGRLLAFTENDWNPAIRLWDRVADEEVGRLIGHGGNGIGQLAFTPRGDRLLSLGEDMTVLVWDVRAPGRPAPAARLSGEGLEKLWADLRGKDAVRAGAAIRRLLASPDQAVAFLRPRLKPAEFDPSQVDRLIDDLDSDRFAVRQRAREGLARLGEAVRPFLRKRLEGKPSLELRRSAEGLLKVLARRVHPPETLRELRAVEVLERTGSGEARKVLEALAEGAPEALLTREAKASLRRLGPGG